jgi:predicted nucleotidyltransferase
MPPSIQSLGGRARARRLTRDERRRIARRAAQARWRDPRKVLADRAVIGDFCRRYGLRGLYVFGSILTPRFTRTSDVDLLYVAEPRLDYATYRQAVEELGAMLGRRVDLIDRRVVEHSLNEFRRRSILGSARPVYEAPR